MPSYSPPIIRNFEIDQVNIGRVNVGRVAVSSEVVLKNNTITGVEVGKEVRSGNEDNPYNGVLDINHLDPSDESYSVNDTALDSTQADEAGLTEPLSDDELETVSNKYIPSKPYKPTGDDPYPNSTPLLAPN